MPAPISIIKHRKTRRAGHPHTPAFLYVSLAVQPTKSLREMVFQLSAGAFCPPKRQSVHSDQRPAALLSGDHLSLQIGEHPWILRREILCHRCRIQPQRQRMSRLKPPLFACPSSRPGRSTLRPFKSGISSGQRYNDGPKEISCPAGRVIPIQERKSRSSEGIFTSEGLGKSSGSVSPSFFSSAA